MIKCVFVENIIGVVIFLNEKTTHISAFLFSQ